MDKQAISMVAELVRIARSLEAVGQETLLATNSSNWRWDYNASETTASVYVDERENLRMEIVNVHTKTGLGAGERRAVLEDVNLGTLSKPRLGMVQGLVRDLSWQFYRLYGTNDRLDSGLPWWQLERRRLRLPVGGSLRQHSRLPRQRPGLRRCASRDDEGGRGRQGFHP